jgi:hypothetical protein
MKKKLFLERKLIDKALLKKEKPATIVLKDNGDRSAFFKKEWENEEERLLRWK